MEGGRQVHRDTTEQLEFGGTGFCGSEKFENQAQKEGRAEQWGPCDGGVGVWGGPSAKDEAESF